MNPKNVFPSKKVQKKIFKDRWVRFAFGPQGRLDSKNLNLGIVEFDKNTVSEPHSHKVEEALYVLSGNAKFILGEKSYQIKADDFIYIPKNTEHKVLTGNQKIRILFIFGGSIEIDK